MTEPWKLDLKLILPHEIWCEECHDVKRPTHYEPHVSAKRLCRKCFIKAGGIIETDQPIQSTVPEPEVPEPTQESDVEHREPMPGQRSCQQCGQPFPAKRSDARFCSPACRQRASRIRSVHRPACDQNSPKSPIRTPFPLRSSCDKRTLDQFCLGTMSQIFGGNINRWDLIVDAEKARKGTS